jgi:hypothetical protein
MKVACHPGDADGWQNTKALAGSGRNQGLEIESSVLGSQSQLRDSSCCGSFSFWFVFLEQGTKGRYQPNSTSKTRSQLQLTKQSDNDTAVHVQLWELRGRKGAEGRDADSSVMLG